jgi:beta-glucosidase
MITETEVEGSAYKKRAWLDELVASVLRLRADDVRMRGLTWWPLVDFVDWVGPPAESCRRSSTSVTPRRANPARCQPAGQPGGPVTPFLRRMGIYSLRADGDGRLTREPTGLLEDFRFHAAGEPAAHPGQRTP